MCSTRSTTRTERSTANKQIEVVTGWKSNKGRHPGWGSSLNGPNRIFAKGRPSASTPRSGDEDLRHRGWGVT